MNITRLRCDRMENPVGFDFHMPSLSWILEDDIANQFQSAFHVQVALDSSFVQTVYDSGKTESRETISYRLSMELSPKTRYFWRVKVWDSHGCPTQWSEPAYFETGRYDQPWQANWIGAQCALPMLRKSFTVKAPVRSARAYACGVGLYELFLNGNRVGNEYLNPNFNAYDQWLQYQTFDITPLLVKGENAVGTWLGTGYYMGRVNWPGLPTRTCIYGDRTAFIMEIDLVYENGEQETILTDESWLTAPSPFDRAEIYDGEVFDACRFDPDWCTPQGDNSGWVTAELVNMDTGKLQARRSVPVKVMHELPVQQVLTAPDGNPILDFGQNFAGWVRFKTDLPAGAQLQLHFGEILDKEGDLYRENLRTAKAEILYISDGENRTYRPHFTFFGFRYVKLYGIDTVNPHDFVAEAVYSACETTGTFTCSDKRVERLFRNALWSQRSNFVDTPTDCPQRDERMGWTGDAQVFCPTASMNMDCYAFFKKYLYDLKLEQKKLGFVPVVVPFILENSSVWEFPTTAWGDAAVLIPWYLYLYFGDRTILEEQYDSMKAWVDYITNCGDVTNGVYGGFHLGDWLAQDTKDPDNFFGLTPPELIATAYYALSSEIVAKAAALLGHAEDADIYGKQAEYIREAFQAEFVSPNGRLAAETQTAAAVALYMNLLKPEQKGTAAARLAHRLREDHLHLTTGFVGTPYLCPALSENGLNQYAYALLLAESCPSWLYEVEMGATTMWERWNSQRPDGSFGPVGMNSFNHYAFGSIAQWLYSYVCGINPVEDAPGFRRARIQPMPHIRLQHAGAELLTPAGKYACHWQIDGETITVEVTIPCNAAAVIHLPDAEGTDIFENGTSIGQIPVVERSSGHWVYTYRYSGNSILSEIVYPAIKRYTT